MNNGKRGKDFEKAAMDYCEDHSHCIYFEAGCEHGYQYAVEKACELIEKLCNSHNIVSIKDGKYKSRSWLEEQFRKAIEE